MVDNFFIQLAVIIIVAAFLGLISKLLKQSIILAYIFAGLLLGPLFFNYIKPSDTLTLFSQLGITLLLFIIGLSMDFGVLKKYGVISLITGIGQIIFTFIIGFFIGKFLGFNVLESVYISIALTFSSTIVVVKLLSDKNDLNTLYGRISIGFLLVQDFLAIFILVFLSGIATSGESTLVLLSLTLVKTIGFVLFVLLFGRFVAPYIFYRFAKTQELLFVSGLSWCFLVMFLSYIMNFSVEIGAFLAGLGLGMLPYSQEIGNKLKPLRDFFIILFFVNLGLQVVANQIVNLIWPAVIFFIVCFNRQSPNTYDNTRFNGL